MWYSNWDSAISTDIATLIFLLCFICLNRPNTGLIFENLQYPPINDDDIKLIYGCVMFLKVALFILRKKKKKKIIKVLHSAVLSDNNNSDI